MNIKQEIEILPAQEPNPINWLFFDSEESYQKHLKETLGEEALKEYLHSNHHNRLAETDIADKYFGHGEFLPKTSMRGSSIDILPEYIGKEWNNEVLGLLYAFRPSKVRVSKTGSVHLDSMNWRITVLLNSDARTIYKIYQEVMISSYGYGVYKDVSENPPSVNFV